MWFIKRRTNPEASNNELKADNAPSVWLDASILRKNNITRLTIDERWTKMFVNIKMSPEIEDAEKEMNELIKKEAMLKNEQENLEPKKRKCMKEIMSLTQEAFDNDNPQAKIRLRACKKDIEKINSRINNVMEDIEKLDDELRAANLKLLNDSLNYIFTTLKTNNERAKEIKSELIEIERREKALREELEAISIDWTKYATDLTELIGADQVKFLEEKFGLEGLNDEASDSPADENH